MLEGTKFGVFMRKIRSEHGDSLRTMAAKLGVTPAFINSLEIGKKQIPLDYVDKIAEIYSLSPAQKRELSDVVYASNEKIVLSLKDFSDKQVELSLAFARKIKDNDKDFIESLNKLLNENKD